MSDRESMKRQAAEAALTYVDEGAVIGVGTGSTAEAFIEVLAANRRSIEGAVASSDATAALLKRHRIEVLQLNHVGEPAVYIDGADEATVHLQLIKGGGGALTREKVIAAASRRFVCIADESKLVDVLGQFPVPIEVIPMARSFVGRRLVAAGGQPVWREDFVTDNGNTILDVHNLDLTDPPRVEAELNQIPGIVTVGLFARKPAHVLLLGTADGVKTLQAPI